MGSKWLNLYRDYEIISSLWPPEYHHILRELLFAKETAHCWMEKYLLPEVRALIDKRLVAHVATIQPGFREAATCFRFSERNILEDVYLAAIYLIQRNWSDADDVYRGQRQDTRLWPILPSLYRRPLTDRKFHNALKEICSLSSYIEDNYPCPLTEVQRVAIAQHYGVRTWLLDVTTSPWVALYFASKGGKKGDVGEVFRIGLPEWDRLSGAGTNNFGKITKVVVPGVIRIKQQKGLFLNEAHPQLLEQYCAETLRFHQHPHLIFRSEFQKIDDSLLNYSDPIAWLVKGWRKKKSRQINHPLEYRPPRSIPPKLIWSDYLAIVLSWCRTRTKNNPLSQFELRALEIACRIHSDLQGHQDIVPCERSIFKLENIVKYMLIPHWGWKKKLQCLINDYERCGHYTVDVSRYINSISRKRKG